MSKRRRCVQELRADAREVEQRELAIDAGVCPFDGLCETCLERFDALFAFTQEDEERERDSA